MDDFGLHGATPYRLMAELEKISRLGPPPIDQWNPPLSGDIDIVIKRDGNWLHEGEAIRRPRLVRLFSTILRREKSGDFVLVTPVEKWRITVEEVPFISVLLTTSGEGEAQVLTLTTNVRDEIPVDAAHPLRMARPPGADVSMPYVTVRDGLEARLARSVYYQLMEVTSERDYEGENWIGVWSCREFFPLMAYQEGA